MRTGGVVERLSLGRTWFATRLPVVCGSLNTSRRPRPSVMPAQSPADPPSRPCRSCRQTWHRLQRAASATASGGTPRVLSSAAAAGGSGCLHPVGVRALDAQSEEWQRAGAPARLSSRGPWLRCSGWSAPIRCPRAPCVPVGWVGGGRRVSGGPPAAGAHDDATRGIVPRRRPSHATTAGHTRNSEGSRTDARTHVRSGANRV